MTSQTEPSGRDKLLHAAVGLLDDHGPDALQTRKVANAAGTSTMAVYTHFGGMRGLIAEIAQEGLRQFAAALAVPPTSDPVADLVATGIAYRRYAMARPHMYRLMFGSTSAHGINAPAHNLLAVSVAEINDRYPSFAHVVRAVHRSMLAGRITAGSADNDAAVVAIAAQFWALIHGFVMLELAGHYAGGAAAVEPVLAAGTANLLVALGDSPERVRQSQRAAASGLGRLT
ncbi:TetR/AcrR family transcriptional regulator [Mycobacterium heckeshornense]|uniref:TetR family transcriptional regulator n=1 Tax=Mycobacterium heckeshornense TaxID=110505 RepID=A0A2G8BK23_9MYCO|nr:TetR/AcrR family transcriptional regulator [Mycobacterium heckeshornense]KMV23804.1 TetR family transcriptional regulator [Mycobacterium heckeshornense]MCV7033571.1 TetR/AcrR family transcriptional regulator [Mycobacterium heckeshornense]PIJ38088.1 TetR/AcrR family transcriptional regulator [Mycobacterium heckeshornense]BCO37627.1 TetR family transcriptional regulator [Mycobacterium heckeshornense]BCQ10477.1 TetR family transcriptional regulator [Mycobacterium heckeshornense]